VRNRLVSDGVSIEEPLDLAILRQRVGDVGGVRGLDRRIEDPVGVGHDDRPALTEPVTARPFDLDVVDPALVDLVLERVGQHPRSR